MKSRFHIAYVDHPRFKHPEVFHDLGQLVGASLASLGHPVTYGTNRTELDASNIIFNYQFAQPPADVYWIPFQLEQLSDADERMNPRWIEMLSKAPEIWDYDPANIAYLQSHGIHTARHVPLGFHPAMRRVPNRAEDIDILHYGSLVNRRRAILDELGRHCRVHAMFGIYGAKRDEYIARSKLVINIHLYESNIFEQARVSYLLNNCKCVVSEDSPYNPYSGMIATAPYERLVEICLSLLKDRVRRSQLVTEGAKRFEAMPMTEILARVIGDR